MGAFICRLQYNTIVNLGYSFLHRTRQVRVENLLAKTQKEHFISCLFYDAVYMKNIMTLL